MTKSDGQILTEMGTDAQKWAQEWCRIAKEIEEAEDGRAVIDEGWMIGWFANAIMAGHDEGYRRGGNDCVQRAIDMDPRFTRPSP